jgi:phosphoglycolate phosphatase
LGFEAVVFDLDGTLVNLGQFVAWNNAKIEVIKKYIILGCGENEVNSCASKGLFPMLNVMWDKLCAENGEDAHNIQSQAFELLELYELEGAKNCIMLQGAEEVLRWLKSRDVPTGLCTSNSQNVAETILETLRLSDYFSSIVGRVPGIKLKPDPEQLLQVFSQLEIDPKKGVMVGDSPGDVLAAKRIGAYTIGIPAYYRKPESLAEVGVDKLLVSLSELPDIFERLVTHNKLP